MKHLLFSIVILGSSLANAAMPAHWEKPYAAIYTELQNNLHSPNNKFPFYHARPAPKYDGVYLWDSSFISLIWNDKDPTIAKDIVQAVLVNQQPNGRIPHVITIFGISEWTQPPLLGWAASRIAAHTSDVDFVRKIYPRLLKYHNWLLSDRRLPSGLFFWQHPYESGLDNSPRFGNRDESHFEDTRTIEAVDLSSYFVLDARALKAMAQMMVDSGGGDDVEALRTDIERYSTEIHDVSALIRSRLWDESTGYFFDLKTDGTRVAIPTLASFFPMTAEVATTTQAARLFDHLQNKAEFNTPIPFPTVARNSKDFDKDCWRGPVWTNTAYLTIQGMKAYGYNAEARVMAYRLVDGVYKTWNNTGKFVEYYDPERLDFDKLTRKRGVGMFQFFSGSKNFWAFLTHLFGKQLYLGTKPVDHFVGWTGLVNVLVHEENLENMPAPLEEPFQ